jgi:predicted ester cyclase
MCELHGRRVRVRGTVGCRNVSRAEQIGSVRRLRKWDEYMVVILDHERGAMTPDEMLAVHREHRAAEDRHDFSAVMATLAPDCFLEQVSLGLRSEGQEDATTAYEEWFGAFPDLGPIPGGIAFGDDVLVAYGQLHGTMKGPWLGLAPTGREFTVPLVNIVPFKDGLMHGERIFYDAATFSEQVGLDVHELRAAASRAMT